MRGRAVLPNRAKDKHSNSSQAVLLFLSEKSKWRSFDQSWTEIFLLTLKKIVHSTQRVQHCLTDGIYSSRNRLNPRTQH